MNRVKQQFVELRIAAERRETDFKDALITFLSSDLKQCLVLETRDTKMAVLKIQELLKHLKENPESQKVIGKYLISENQSFLTWEQLLTTARQSKSFPRFKNLLVCEFFNLLRVDKDDKEILNEIIDRYNISATKKIIFVTLQEGLLDEYLRNMEMRGVLKIDEFNSKVTSILYADEIEALIESASRGHLTDVAELLKSGVNVNLTNRKDEFTSLHVAALNGYKDVVLMLLRNGAHILPNGFKQTPLHLAAQNGHKDVVSVLVENEADVNFKNNWGSTALHEAVYCGHNDVVKILLKYDANINAQNDNRSTALHFAALKNNTDAVGTFLKNGAEIDIKDSAGDTPLHIAAYKGNWDVVEILIEKGADVNVRNNSSKTPLDLARGANHKRIVELLLTKNEAK